MTEDTPHTAIEPQPAGFWRRGTANMIDGMIFFAILMVIYASLATWYEVESMSVSMYVSVTLMAFFAVSIAFYSTLFLSSRWQATPGKRLMQVYITDKNGKKISKTRAFVRYWAVGGLFFLLKLIIEVLFIGSFVTATPSWLSAQDQQRFHELNLKDLKNGKLTDEEERFVRKGEIPPAPSTMSVEEASLYNAIRQKSINREELTPEEKELRGVVVTSLYVTPAMIRLNTLTIISEILYGIILICTVAWSRSKRGLHDRICGTRAYKGRL